MFHKLSDLQGIQVGEIKQYCANLKSKRMREVTLADLTIHVSSFGGIYAFYNDSDCLYVGKTSSRSFIERIAGHFDSRETAYMNHFLKKLVKQKICGDFHSAINFALNCKVILFTFSSDNSLRENHKMVENFLRTILEPQLNARNDSFDSSKLVKNYLSQV
jgi:hypothetical protein